jgi:two-component system, chemotaxis family, chemotaxis protein CheY
MKCLIVEDNQQNYELLQRMLEDYGVINVADNGADAFEEFKFAHLEHDPYNVIFLDIVMPGLDGHEVLKIIREWESSNPEITKKVQIVMATAKSDTDTIVSSFDDGCQHFFVKPYDKSELDELMMKMGFSK